MTIHDLAERIRRSLSSAADPSKAPQMRAHMKSAMPYYGVREFFLRKAIGWALREYARTDAGWVLDFVAAREVSLSPLSRREALNQLA